MSSKTMLSTFEISKHTRNQGKNVSKLSLTSFRWLSSRIFFQGVAKSIVMLVFLMFSDKILGGG